MRIGTIKKLLFKEIFGQTNVEEKERINKWLESSQGNKELYDKIRSMSFLEKAMTDDNSVNRGRVWKEVARHIRPRTSRLIRLSRIAAILAVPLILGGVIYTLHRTGSAPIDTVTDMLIQPGSPKVIVTLPTGEEIIFNENSDRTYQTGTGNISLVNEDNTVSLVGQDYGSAGEVKYTTYSIPNGGEYTVRLDDGTTVIMNSGSRLSAPVKFGNGPRTVEFSGEGYFNVAHDEGREFIVNTDRASVTVHGTEFNIRNYGDEYEFVATLVEGSVSVISETNNAVTMVPNSQARVGENGNVVVGSVNVYPYIAWKDGRIVFENARTEDIMRELSRWYNFEVRFADQAAKDRRFTMDIMKYDDITSVLDLMSKLKVYYEIQGNQISLSSRRP